MLWRLTDDSRDDLLAAGTVGDDGRIRLSVDLRGVGRYCVQLSVAATDTNAQDISPTRTVTLR